MKIMLANLCGPPLEVETEIVPISHIDFCWNDNRMSEKRTGMLICRGTKGNCIYYTQKLFLRFGTKRLKEYFSNIPTAEELYEIRKELLTLQSNYRRLTRVKLQRELNKNSVAGDLFVTRFPEEKSARARKILNKIKEIQERTFEL